MSIDHKVIFPEILYDCMTIYQYDTGRKTHIAYLLKLLIAEVLSYNSSVSFKNKISLLLKMKEKEADYKSKVIRESHRHEYNIIYSIRHIFK